MKIRVKAKETRCGFEPFSITSQYMQGTSERRQSLNQAFLNYKFKADHFVRTHIEAIKLLTKNYKDAGGQTTEDEIINRILTSLPPSYDNFIAPWESTAKDERTLANLTTRLCSQEERTNLRSGGQKSTDDKAFFGETPQQSSRSASNPNSNQLIDDFDPTQEEGGEEGDSEIATLDSPRPTAHHEDKENAGTAMALVTGRMNAGRKRSRIRKPNPPRQKTQRM